MSSKLNTQSEFTSLSLEEMLSGYRLSQAIFALYHLELPEYLHQQGAQDLSQIGKAIQIETWMLEHLLEIAQTLNLVHKDEQNRYSLTAEGLRLCPDTTDSIIPILAHYDCGYGPWGSLFNSLETGKSAFEQVYQTDIFSYFSQHPEQNSLFSRFMEQTTQTWLAQAELGKHYNFSGHLIDIGGNTGALSALLLQQFPKLQATVFDLEQAMIGADTILSTAGVSDRCRLVSGSFFEPQTIPKDGDIYLFSRVLLNWNDEKAVEILKNCRSVMPPDSKLLILDFVLSDSPLTSQLLASLNLWVMFNARFRKQAEFKRLVEQAGFRYLRWIEIDNMKFFLEASP